MAAGRPRAELKATPGQLSVPWHHVFYFVFSELPAKTGQSYKRPRFHPGFVGNWAACSCPIWNLCDVQLSAGAPAKLSHVSQCFQVGRVPNLKGLPWMVSLGYQEALGVGNMVPALNKLSNQNRKAQLGTPGQTHTDHIKCSSAICQRYPVSCYAVQVLG